jgi:A/G-specific adenine glycosylase
MAPRNRQARKVRAFQKKIREYYRAHGRALPWRNTQNVYRILVSEIMLQQTQVARVTSKYPAFIAHFPDFESLRDASQSDVLKAWQGLGYNRRALALKKIAEVVIGRYNGKLPKTREELMSLPGIGAGTAGSLLAFAFNKPSVFIETNIRRVFLHHFFPNRTAIRDALLFPLIEASLDTKKPREWYYALMDYGAMLGKANKENPNRRSKHYAKQSKFEGSNRELRGKIIKLLIKNKLLTIADMARLTNESKERIAIVVARLKHEEFLTASGRSIRLTR